jgi:hypothetical protein
MNMTKQDKLDLIAGKCFNNSSLADEECDLLHSTKISELIKLGFNLDQADFMMRCCKRNMLKRRSKIKVSEDEKC